MEIVSFYGSTKQTTHLSAASTDNDISETNICEMAVDRLSVCACCFGNVEIILILIKEKITK